MPKKPAPRRPGNPAGKPRRQPPRGGRPAPAPRFRRPLAAKPTPTPAVAPTDDDESKRTGERLQKVLAAAGIASRRECEQFITEGRVEVDGQVVTELGARVDRNTQEIKVDGETLPRPRLAYFAIHKPAGVVTTTRDPAGRPRVIDLLPPSLGRVFPVGRLDLESEGLILATNDGDLANQITHPKHGIEKTYEVQVAGHMEPDVLVQLRRGVHLSEGYAHAVRARIKSKLKKSTLLEMVLDEGRNREVRRLLARVGHKVQRLTRVAVGPVRLGEMPRGAYRKLSAEEVRQLRDAIAAGPKPKRDEPLQAARSIARPARPGGPPRVSRPARPGGPPRAGGPAKKRPYRKPESETADGVPAKPDFSRKVLGGDAPTAGGQRTGAARAGGKPSAGKPKYRKPTGTKLTGRKPIKRRRPERPQRGGN